MRLDDCGDVVTRAQVVEIFQYRSIDVLYEAIKRGDFPEADLQRPKRWFRDRLRLWVHEGQRVGQRQVRHKIAG